MTPTRVLNTAHVTLGAADQLYIGRPRDARGRPSDVIPDPPWKGSLANPFDPRTWGAARAQELFERYFATRLADDRRFRAHVLSCGGLRLVCDCDAGGERADGGGAAAWCHGRTIAKWVDEQRAGDAERARAARESASGAEIVF